LQRKNMMAANYRHIGGGDNRLGRHYSRFFEDLAHGLPCRSITCSVKIVKRQVESAKTGYGRNLRQHEGRVGQVRQATTKACLDVAEEAHYLGAGKLVCLTA